MGGDEDSAELRDDDDFERDEEDDCSGSCTEDECDEQDGAMKNKNFSQKLTLSPGDELSGSECIESFSRLRISESQKFMTASSHYLPPFIPKLPQGKPFKGMLLAKKKSLEEESLYLNQKGKAAFGGVSGVGGQRRRASLATTTPSSVFNVPSRNFPPPPKLHFRPTKQILGAKSTPTKEQDVEKDKASQTGNTVVVVQKRRKFRFSKHKKSH